MFRTLEPGNPPSYSDAIPEHGPAVDASMLGATIPYSSHTADPVFPAPEDFQVPPPVGPFPDELPLSRFEILEEGSEQIRAAWRSLRLSAEYRPELLLSWEQPTDGNSPVIFVHNEEILAVEDPWFQLRTVPPGTTHTGSDADPEEERSVQDYLFLYDFERGEMRLAAMPAPRDRYQVEGTVRLRRERFLHVELDLSWTEPAPGVDPLSAGVPLRAEYLGYQVYTLKQSRQVRKERLEYFDSPFLGVLVMINEFEPEEADPAP